MDDWDEILVNYKATGSFHGKGRAAEDAYFAFFGKEPMEGRIMRLGLQTRPVGAVHLSVFTLIHRITDQLRQWL